MDKPISFTQLFRNKLFRIPDYQRGYAWQKEQLAAFWEDLINLKDDRKHYTGVLTLTEISKDRVPEDSKEYGLVSKQGYGLFHVVDGQQRLTTFVVAIQSLVNFIKNLQQNKEKNSNEIYVLDDLKLADIERNFLYENNDKKGFRTYKFGYTDDNPSQEFLRFQILGESGKGVVEETFYTLNLGNAKKYFSDQITELYRRSGDRGLDDLYKKLTQHLLVNEYVIEDEFDVFVAFETMNNRGKKLSDLELLKNRLIYLSTLYDETKLGKDGRKALRDDINAAWKEVYHQIGRNKTKPLNDDDFLRAHWISYFKYSRDTGRDYAHFLLDEHFIPKNVNPLNGHEVTLEKVEEQRSEIDFEDQDEINPEAIEEAVPVKTEKLGHKEILEYVSSLKESAVCWFNSWYPELVADMHIDEKQALDRLNRIGIGYFRPLVMVILKKEPSVIERIRIFSRIERFIFLAFRLGASKGNYRSSEFYRLARDFNNNKITLVGISDRLDANLLYTFNDDKSLRITDFENALDKKFSNDGAGYYGWSGLRYVLFEYEQYLKSNARQAAKVTWADFLKPNKDRISIEHVYPQTSTIDWELPFVGISQVDRARHCGTIGNLLLLSASINSSLQNDSFKDKKNVTTDNATGKTIRNGYKNGSYSEIEIADEPTWGPLEIWNRGNQILKFMEKRWDFDFRENEREKLLFINRPNDS